MERIRKAQNRKVGRPRRHIINTRPDLLGRPVHAIPALPAAVKHKGSLEGQLVGLGAGLRGEDVVKSRWSGAEEAVFEGVMPGGGGEIADCGAVDEGGDHFGGFGGFD